jgi:UDP-N-acetylmuramate dehydrogenase
MNPKDPRNPEGPRLAAWKLLKESGAADIRSGGARLSGKHANFVEAAPGAKTADVAQLIRQARQAVLDHHGLHLVCEVKTLGPVDLV